MSKLISCYQKEVSSVQRPHGAPACAQKNLPDFKNKLAYRMATNHIKTIIRNLENCLAAVAYNFVSHLALRAPGQYI